ncbi:MAG TPA: serine/threonine protein kinase [Polyangiaceae bacterium]|nr:serine/threonine protein kinase [Polyangiaceae bacterium]
MTIGSSGLGVRLGLPPEPSRAFCELTRPGLGRTLRGLVRLVSLLPTDPPRYLDRYQLVGEIASGGMATVYLARLSGAGGFKRLVAIKQLHPHLASKQDYVQMFLDEARLAAGIHHRNVVPILEIGNTEAGFYLVMEYVEGVTLSRLARPKAQRKSPVPHPILLRIILDALSGLHASHELVGEDGRPLELVHRDCSPQNLLVGLDGCTRLTDFGVARARIRIHTTKAGGVKGKVGYMAPENARGDDVDRRADIFGMGVVLWEALAARELFVGDHEVEVLTNVLTAPIPMLSEVDGTIPVALAQVCGKALDRDPEGRFSTAREMAEAIEQAADTVASERDVEAFMQARFGERAARRRDMIRRWFQGAQASISELPPPSNPTPSAPDASADFDPDAPLEVVGTGALPPRELDLPSKASSPAPKTSPGPAPSPRRTSRPPAVAPELGDDAAAFDPPPRQAPALRSTDPETAGEVERAVKASLARRGVSGSVVVREGVIELHREDGEAPVAIDIDEWLSQWNLLPEELRNRRAESAAERLQKITGEGKRIRRTDDPIERVRARERLTRWLATFVVLAVGAATGWWLWAHGFFGERGPSMPSLGGSEAPTAPVTARTHEATGARSRRACDAARERILSGRAMGIDVEGWVVELWLARDEDQDDLRADPVLGRVAREGALVELGVKGEGAVTLHALDLPDLAAALLRFDRDYAAPFFETDGRERYLRFAAQISERLGARYAGLYARCAHRATRDIGAWYAGASKEAALAAMLWTAGASSDPLPTLEKQVGAVKGERVDDILRKVGAREVVAGEGQTSTVALRFPLGGANSANKASKALQAAL